MQYEIAAADNLDALSKEVNEYIGKGWVPQGGICNQSDDLETGSNRYLQAMIKEDSTDRKPTIPQSGRRTGLGVPPTPGLRSLEETLDELDDAVTKDSNDQELHNP